MRREAFRAKTLDAQLDDAMRIWIADPGKGLSIDRNRARVRLSKIFDWFKEDFAEQAGVLACVIRYATPAGRDWLERNASRVAIRYFNYDWQINAVR